MTAANALDNTDLPNFNLERVHLRNHVLIELNERMDSFRLGGIHAGFSIFQYSPYTTWNVTGLRFENSFFGSREHGIVGMSTVLLLPERRAPD